MIYFMQHQDGGPIWIAAKEAGSPYVRWNLNNRNPGPSSALRL
jgi:hypothetical protein